MAHTHTMGSVSGAAGWTESKLVLFSCFKCADSLWSLTHVGHKERKTSATISWLQFCHPKSRKHESAASKTHENAILQPPYPRDGEQAVCCFHRQRSVFWTCHNVSVRVLFLDAAISETLIGAYKSQRDFQNYEGLSTEACRKKSPYISKSSLLADFNHLLRSLKSSLWLYLTYQE